MPPVRQLLRRTAAFLVLAAGGVLAGCGEDPTGPGRDASPAASLAVSTAQNGSLPTVSSGLHQTCSVTGDGRAICWGSNQFGEAAAPAGTFVQVIYILGNDLHIEFFFQRRQGRVRGIGLGFGNIAPAHVIKFEHQLRVPFPGTRCGYFVYIVAFP